MPGYVVCKCTACLPSHNVGCSASGAGCWRAGAARPRRQQRLPLRLRHCPRRRPSKPWPTSTLRTLALVTLCCCARWASWALRGALCALCLRGAGRHLKGGAESCVWLGHALLMVVGWLCSAAQVRTAAPKAISQLLLVPDLDINAANPRNRCTPLMAAVERRQARGGGDGSLARLRGGEVGAHGAPLVRQRRSPPSIHLHCI